MNEQTTQAQPAGADDQPAPSFPRVATERLIAAYWDFLDSGLPRYLRACGRTELQPQEPMP